MSTAAQHLRALATERFPTLTPAEERLLGRVADGKEAHYETTIDGEKDLQQANTWGTDRIIHAEVLRWLCVDRDAIRHIDPQGISIHGARIDGSLDLSMVTIPFPLFLVRCAIREVNLAFAEVRLLGIEGSISESIHGDGMVVHGDLWLRHGFRAKGGVRLVNTTITGDLNCSGGQFRNEGGTALDAAGAKIGGSIILRQWKDAEKDRLGFHAEGEVRLAGATIAGDLDCSGGTFHQAGGTALHADSAKIDGNVFLRQGFQAEGFVRFPGAHIQGHLDCQGASFTGDAPNGLEGEAMVVGRALDWREVTTNAATILNLAGAHAGQLADDAKSWPGSAHLDLDGFVYGAIFDGPADAPTRLCWLERQTPVPLYESEQLKSSPRPFRPQPYQQLAKVLRERGQEADARQILIGKEKARLKKDRTLPKKDRTLSRRARCWHLFLGYSMAHGYRPQWLLLYALIPFVLGSIFFMLGDQAELMVPSKAEVYRHYDRGGQVPPFYPMFNPIVYSLDTLLPIINFGHKDHWGPRGSTSASSIPRQWAQLPVDSAVDSFLSPTAVQGEAQDGGPAATLARAAWATIRSWVTWGSALHLYRGLHIAAGWLLITLGVAGVTGLVRKE
jgi:hypothetical protein